MGCIAEIVYGTVECNGDCEHCHWWDDSTESERDEHMTADEFAELFTESED